MACACAYRPPHLRSRGSLSNTWTKEREIESEENNLIVCENISGPRLHPKPSNFSGSSCEARGSSSLRALCLGLLGYHVRDVLAQGPDIIEARPADISHLRQQAANPPRGPSIAFSASEHISPPSPQSLDHDTRQALLAVCRRKSLLDNAVLRALVDDTVAALDLSATPVTDKALAQVLPRCAAHLSALDLSRCPRVSSQLLRRLPSLTPGLRVLRLGGCQASDRAGLQALGAILPRRSTAARSSQDEDAGPAGAPALEVEAVDDWESIAGPGAKAPQRRAVGGLTELTHLVWMGKTVRGDRAKPEDRESEDRGFTEAVGQGTAAGSDGNAGLGSDAGFAAATDGVARSRRRAHVRACQPGPGREAPLCDSECDAAARARAEAARLAPEVTVVSEAWLERLGGRRRQGGREPRRDLPFGADPRVAMDDWAISLVGPRGLEEPPEHRDRKAQLRVEWKALPLAEKFRMAYAWREHEQRELSAKEDKRWRAEASRASGAFRAIEAWLDAG